MNKEKFLSSLYKKEEIITKGKTIKPIERVKTTSPSLNWALGGGVPVGYLIQHAGEPSSGKSLVAMLEGAEWQKHFKNDGIVVIADFEHTTSLERAAQVGLDITPGKFFMWKRQDNSGAVFFDWLNNEFLPGCIENGIKPFIILDSKDNMVPPSEEGRGSGEMEYAAMAKFLKRVLKRTVAMLAKANGTMVVINQLTIKIGQMFGNPETTSGGNALKHNSALDIWFKKIDKKDELIKDSRDETIGHKVTFRIPKNKVGSPFRKGGFNILYKGEIINQHMEVFEMSKKLGVVGRPTNRQYEMESCTDKAGRFWTSKGAFQEAIKNYGSLRDELIARFDNYEEWSKKFKEREVEEVEEEDE